MTSGASGHEPTVLVVGAGPTGLASALCLARAGVAVRVVDRSARPAATSRAIGIQARTLELLDLELVTIIHAHRPADDDRSTTAERFFLIRPDAYVALQGPLQNLPKL